jgi:hypothetical protein
MTTGGPTVAFMRELHNALRYLYVPAELRSNPLLDVFQIDPQEGPFGHDFQSQHAAVAPSGARSPSGSGRAPVGLS